MSYTRHIACVTILCVGYPQTKFLSVRHKGDMKRNHFAWQHTMKGAGGLLFFVVTVIVSWVPLTKKCFVAFRSLSVRMLPVMSDQCPAILKWRKWLQQPV